MESNNTKISSVALAVIGDEVLLGEVKDLNISIVSREVFRLGADLPYVCVLPDDPEFMFEHLTWMKERFDWVVTTGGIGATHDDLTKQVVSRIVGRALVEAPEAIKALENRIGLPLSPRVRELALVPEGAELVTNELTAAPGFIVANFLVLPGIPSLVKSMIGVLETKLSGIAFQTEVVRTMLRESEIAHHLEAVQEMYPAVKVGSYPQMEATDHRVKIVLRSRDADSLREAVRMLLKRIEE
ncbi:molybdopterin-binding protein [bacterium]|nr:molybdopterin-binding protein [bacterium]